MKCTTPVASSCQWAGSLTPRTFGRAAWFATRLVVIACTIEFLAMAVVFRDSTALAVGLVLIPLMTLAIWMTAAVLGTVLLLPKWIWSRGHELALRLPRTVGCRSGLWDDWLDGPKSKPTREGTQPRSRSISRDRHNPFNRSDNLDNL